mgnify:CR=1 FL=1
MLQLPSMKRNASSLSSLAAIRSSKSAAMNRCSLLRMKAACGNVATRHGNRLQRFLAADLFFNVCSLRSVDLWLLRLSSESKPVPPWSMTLQLPAGPRSAPDLLFAVCTFPIRQGKAQRARVPRVRIGSTLRPIHGSRANACALSSLIFLWIAWIVLVDSWWAFTPLLSARASAGT